MIKNIGIELPQDVYNLLRERNVMALLATYSDKGIPHITPIHTLFPKNKESILLCMLNNQIGYQNMVWQKKVMLTIIEGPNIVCHILGRAGIVRAPSRVHPLIHIAQIDVIDILPEQSMLVTIESGIQWGYTSSEAQTLYEALMRELKECAENL